MARRRIIALTEAQIGVLNWALRNLQESDSAPAEGDALYRHIANIDRQLSGAYTSTERASIFEEAVRLSKVSEESQS